MAPITTPGHILISDALPEDLRKDSYDLDKKGIRDLLREVALHSPDKYREIAQKLMVLGHHASQSSGASISLKALLQPPEIKASLDKLKARINQIAESDLGDQAKEDKIVKLVLESNDAIKDGIYNYGLANNNPFALQAKSGSRGKSDQIRQLVAGDGLVADHMDRVIGVPILHGYAEGLDPVEYFAASYGARKGSVSTKQSTAKAGFMGKQLVQAAHRMVVTMDDCGTSTGMPFKATDPDNVGTVLASDIGPYKAGTVVTANMLKKIGDKEIRVRSPITCQAPEGICAKCAGVREKGRLPDIGDNVGVTAAQALGERVSQGMLCLGVGTAVRMADGDIKLIEEIKVGDMVLGSDKYGRTSPTKVLNTFNNGDKTCNVYVIDDKTLVATPDHKILARVVNPYKVTVELEIKPLKDVERHPDLISVCSSREVVDPAIVSLAHADSTGRYALPADHKLRGHCLISVLHLSRPMLTYDIEVDHADHLFVLANGLVVSNSAKHSGGQVGAAGPSKAGFNYVNSLIQTPESFHGAAALASTDGRVSKIEPAPQGGQYVYVDKEQHYVPPDQAVTVKPGQEMEAGDSLSNGTPNPADLIQYKGIGETRQSMMQSLYDGFKASDITPNRRNVEMIARSLVNHVRITPAEGYGGFLPDDIVSFDELRTRWEPREGAEEIQPARARNMYLESPVLHHTIGTRITPRLINDLNTHGVTKITAHKDKPPFEPVMVRAMEHSMRDKNWMTRMYGSYLSRGFLDAVHRGSSADMHSTSFVPSLAEGTHFGDKLETEGKY